MAFFLYEGLILNWEDFWKTDCLCIDVFCHNYGCVIIDWQISQVCIVTLEGRRRNSNTLHKVVYVLNICLGSGCLVFFYHGLTVLRKEGTGRNLKGLIDWLGLLTNLSVFIRNEESRKDTKDCICLISYIEGQIIG